MKIIIECDYHGTFEELEECVSGEVNVINELAAAGCDGISIRDESGRWVEFR